MKKFKRKIFDIEVEGHEEKVKCVSIPKSVIKFFEKFSLDGSEKSKDDIEKSRSAFLGKSEKYERIVLGTIFCNKMRKMQDVKYFEEVVKSKKYFQKGSSFYTELKNLDNAAQKTYSI